MQIFHLLSHFIFLVLSLLIAVIAHEYSHGLVAEKLGDSTARNAGRLSLNPIVHIDPVGTIVLPVILFIMSGGTFVFGWAKPVPVNQYNLHNPKTDMAKVAIAGPISNFVVASAAAILLRLGGILPSELLGYRGDLYITNPALLFLGNLILINVLLGVFNLLPIPPLDVSQIVQAYLPRHIAWHYKRIEPYGMVIIILLFFVFDFFDLLIEPLIKLFVRLFSLP